MVILSLTNKMIEKKKVEQFTNFLSKFEFARVVVYFLIKFPIFLALFVISAYSYNSCPYLATFIILHAFIQLFYVSSQLIVEIMGCYIREIIALSLNVIIDVLNYLLMLCIEIYGFVILIIMSRACTGGPWETYQLITTVLLLIHGFYNLIDITNFLSIFLLFFHIFFKKLITENTENSEKLEE